MLILTLRRHPVNISKLFALFFLVVTACSGHFETRPDELVVGIENPPTTFDPRLASDTPSSRINQLIYSRLMTYDDHLNLVPDLLASYEFKPPQTYQFFLKPGVLFHHGRELTSEDVRYTLESLRESGLASPWQTLWDRIASLRITGPYSFEIVLTEPFVPFLSYLTVGILPSDSGGRILGSGPYRFVRYQAGEKIVLARYESYFGKKPIIPNLIFQIIPEDTVRTLELVNKRIDILQNAVPPSLIPYLKKLPGMTVRSEPGITYHYLGFNLRDPHLGNFKVRQAIAMAIDVPSVITYRLAGMARPATGLLAPLHRAYRPDVTTYPYNPEKARLLLDEAGFPDPDGLGPQSRFRITYKTSTKRDRIGVAHLVSNYLESVGIEVQVLSYEWGRFFQEITQGNFQLYSLNWAGVVEPDIYYTLFHSSQFPPVGDNRGFFKSGEVDRLTAEARQTLDPEKRKELYSKIQKIVALTLPAVSLWYEDNVVAFHEGIEGYTLRPDASYLGLVQTTKK
ncbi:MAG: ABC transporter substrate-binding protein [Deltaproteobacteria bacterium]|nr:ABC transporter substrate-binding protein [Deltaproteobacteria bacterium]